jgi:hypothetical protein
MIEKLLEPEVREILLTSLIGFLYITGRITRNQFMAEQMKSKGFIGKQEAKATAVEGVTKPITVILDVLDYIPILNARLPFVNQSIPGITKSIIQLPIGLISDILHNFPLLGTRVKTK